jgi:hypothetical protein
VHRAEADQVGELAQDVIGHAGHAADTDTLAQLMRVLYGMV